MTETVSGMLHKSVKSKARSYIVLKKEQSGASWRPVNTIDATSADAAIRKAADLLFATGDDADPVTLVAVTANRFVPVTVTSEVQTRLKLDR